MEDLELIYTYFINYVHPLLLWKFKSDEVQNMFISKIGWEMTETEQKLENEQRTHIRLKQIHVSYIFMKSFLLFLCGFHTKSVSGSKHRKNDKF
jgi:hypothetical protein